ncbi:smp-30 gluconolaconase lre-like region protein [Moesziomyces antarcticus]|uniref:Related to Gluconolactonase n=2 Tax=Pseudozyma antarctica TaxID=84753 RepID=A0A5C3FVM3_PSEA2|nr:smp-30 gluconolaconase lre-like region protein [Moesziomyces antarcticus]GAK66995.1 smp-30 gluconolaconase lre-like region protein [Moesziomyces antarcticus]SPO48240.1 related to Gluconolactonase [Moesziomyces antarcticus]
MPSQTSTEPVGVVSLDPEFDRLAGTSATMRKLLTDPEGLQRFHEAGIYLAKHNKVYLSSNRLPHPKVQQSACIIGVPLDSIPSPSTEQRASNGLLPDLTSDEQNSLWSALQVIDELPGHLALPNGATHWDQDSVLWCEQGHDKLAITSSLVVHNVAERTGKAVLSQFEGKPFSSLNDAVPHPPSGSFFFTDPDYGIEQSFKSPDVTYAPNALYMWKPSTNQVRLIDSNYSKPNGVTFVPSPANDGSGLLITSDTGRFRFHRNDSVGEFYVDDNGPAHLYSYKVLPDSESKDGLPAVDVGSRTEFAESTSGVPDGIHVDTYGNVWAGHGNGVHVYKPQPDGTGKLIGKFVIPGEKGVANFCWAGQTSSGQYRLLLFAEVELWEVTVAVNGQD